MRSQQKPIWSLIDHLVVLKVIFGAPRGLETVFRAQDRSPALVDRRREQVEIWNIVWK
jgi:hypothetical protein